MTHTKFDAEVYKLVHADYDGLTINQAAEMLGMSTREIRRSIKRLRKYVTITLLTERQREIRDYILDAGLTHAQIAVLIKTSVGNVEKVVATLKSKGVYLPQKPKTEKYKSHMDNKIVRKF